MDYERAGVHHRRALRERLFSEEYREKLKEYMLIYGGYHDMLLSEEEVSSEIISAEEE